MNGHEVKPGLVVELTPGAHVPTPPGGEKRSLDGSWEVLDRSPKPSCWWLHRWEGNRWAVIESHARNLIKVTHV